MRIFYSRVMGGGREETGDVMSRLVAVPAAGGVPAHLQA